MKITPQLSMGLLIAAAIRFVDGADALLSVHGSGTSNPALCFGYIMEEMQARAKLPIRLTYRSVGSTTGLKEFTNEMNLERSALDFGSGEIPMPREDWQAFKDQNVTVLQLPALFGAVSFFHSVPDTPNLNLTSCLLARIFMRDIKDWAHPDIREINPGLSRLFESQNMNSLGASLRIRVARREEGGSNNLAITEYLHKACPHYFPQEMVGAVSPWPEDTEACRGTIGMNECIEARAGTIGYNEAGIGLLHGLQEISIKNKYGRLLTSEIAAANGGIGAKEDGVLPPEPTDDFSSVSLLDQDGEYTWPITLLTYLYVRTDLNFKTDPAERALLVAFIKAIYDPGFNERCASSHGFSLAAGSSLKLGQKGIEILEGALGDPEVNPRWTFETKAEALVGAGDYVLSANRKNYPAIERESNLEHVQELEAKMAELEAKILALTAAANDPSSKGDDDEAEFTSQYEAMILTSLIVGILSLALVFGLAILTVVSKRTPVVAGDVGEAK